MKSRKFFRISTSLSDLTALKIKSDLGVCADFKLVDISYNGMSIKSINSSFRDIPLKTIINFYIEHESFIVFVQTKVTYVGDRLLGLEFLDIKGDIDSFYNFLDIPLLYRKAPTGRTIASNIFLDFPKSVLLFISKHPAITLIIILVMTFLLINFKLWNFFF